MNTIPISSYRSFPKLHPLSLLAQVISRQLSGCLQVSSKSTVWSIYLHQGKLVYASNSDEPFERLDRHLRRISTQATSLVSAVRVQVRLLFDKPTDDIIHPVADYEAICWLVEQQHLEPSQAASLIEELAKETLESFLSLQEGSYEIIETDAIAQLPRFCQFELRPLVEYCQTQLRQRQVSKRNVTSLLDRTRSSNPPTTSTPTSSSVKMAIAPQSIPEPSAPTPPLKPAPSSSKGTYTVACIDDSPTVLHAINTYLDDKSFTVIMIDNPVKALMQIVRHKPDLILLDVTMPNLDGYELCSLLRKHPNFKQTPIIMVTGNTGFIDRAKAKLAGASGYLTKPFTQSDLIKIVFKHLS